MYGYAVMIYKGDKPPLMICTQTSCVMIYQTCGLDKKYCRKYILFCSIFWWAIRDSNP